MRFGIDTLPSNSKPLDKPSKDSWEWDIHGPEGVRNNGDLWPNLNPALADEQKTAPLNQTETEHRKRISSKYGAKAIEMKRKMMDANTERANDLLKMLDDAMAEADRKSVGNE